METESPMQETVYGTGNEETHDVMSEKVQTLAGNIYQEFQRMIEKYDEDVVKDLMPLVVNVLESLDLACMENQEHEVELELLREDNEQLVTQYEREKQLRKASEQKLLEVEYTVDDDRRDLEGKVEGLESVIRMLELKSKNTSDHANRLEEKESEMKKEFSKLHERYTELFKTHMDYIERTKILFGSDRMEMTGSKGNRLGLHFAPSKSPGGPSSLALSGETTPARSVASLPDYPDLISPTKSPDASTNLKSEIQEVKVGVASATTVAPQPATEQPSKVGQVQTTERLNLACFWLGSESGWVDGFSTDMSMSETTSLTPEVEDIEEIAMDSEVGIDKTTVHREQRRPNTLYQELSFHDENLGEGEDGSDVTESDSENEADNHAGKNVTDNIFGMGKEVENIIMENIELLATKNALNIVKDDLIARVDLLTSEKEILQGELKALEHIRDAQKQKIHEMEEEMKKVREELEKMKAAKSDDEQEDVPMAQRKRFTRVEMARVLMERNQYKERYMELQEAIRWTGMIKASRTDPTMDSKKNRSSIWKIFSNLFSTADKPQQKPISTVNVRYSAPSTRLSPALESMRKKRLGEKHRGFDFLDSDLASERLQAQRARERREQYKQVRAHVRKDDGRVQAYGWSLPTKTTPVKLDLPPSGSGGGSQLGVGPRGAPSHVPVPVPVFCRPLQDSRSPMKVWCAAGVNLTGGRTRDGGTIVGASIFYKEQGPDPNLPSPSNDIDRLDRELKEQEAHRREQEEMAQHLSSLVWICTSTHTSSEVSVVDANNPADILDSFHVCPSHLLCIASVPGAKETDYPVDEEFSRLGTGEEVTQKPKQPPAQREKSSSKDADAQSSDAKDQDANLGVGKLTFVKCAVGSGPSSPPDERGEGPAAAIAEAVEAIEELEGNGANEGGPAREKKEPIRRPWVLLKEGAPPDIVKDGISELPTDNHLAYDQLEKMSSVLPTMWLGSQNGTIYMHSSVAQWRVCIDFVTLCDSVLSIVHVKGRVFAALADGTVAIFHRKQDGQWDLKNYHLLDLGKPHHSIRCLTVAHTKVWCGYRNRIHVVNPKTLTVEHSFDAHPRKESQIRQMAWVGDGVWVTIRLDSTLRLYNVHTYQHLQDIDIEPYVSKMLGAGKLGFSFVRITALLISCNRLWMGTGNGVIISVPLSESNKQTMAASSASTSTGGVGGGIKMPGGVVRVYSDSRENITTGSFVPYCSMAQAQLSFHGHRDAVKFFVAVPGTGGIISSGLKGSPEKKPDVSLGADGSGPKCMLVLSGGEGYIDFRIGDGDEEESGESIQAPASAGAVTTAEKKLHQGVAKGERSHLIVWEVALNE
ncbi:C-Jun-amino-terminal kinase-interacting protein 4 isoform X3 [Ixodes scapularis]|uniref:C-Jun-amino-terminal kinase-interacting protein 4 isoform X3 n=1 Tax=Ixodes scapularis TaxID=6945 RepID=UPI001A9E0EE1|nr:C-Jun-amino-terminal kinase-interacting protein 4 isoform X3 [Ixodes scapularis]